MGGISFTDDEDKNEPPYKDGTLNSTSILVQRGASSGPRSILVRGGGVAALKLPHAFAAALEQKPLMIMIMKQRWRWSWAARRL